MTDLSRPWPFGIDSRRWWIPVLAALAVVAAATLVDQPLSGWAQGLGKPVHKFMEAITRLGLSDWTLYPAAILFIVTAAVALAVRWRLMRTMLWQLTALYAFIFVGTGFPGLVTVVLKRIIGRGRPMHLTDTGLFGLKPNLLDWTYQSFPSGHSTTIFAVAMVTAFLSGRLLYPALLVAITVAASRVVLGDHYPSDVIAGAVVGILGAYAARWYFARRGWLFVMDQNGRIHARALASIKRYIELKRRGIAPTRQPDRT